MKTAYQPKTSHDLLPGESFKPEPLGKYDQQAEAFLAKFGIKFRATMSDTKAPPWRAEDSGICGHHYRVTLSKGKPCTPEYSGNICSAARLTFDFWGSIADANKGIVTERPYNVLACISGDVHCPETFADFCGDYGYETDSIKALQTFRRCASFGKRLRAFFTEAEIEALSEIQ